MKTKLFFRKQKLMCMVMSLFFGLSLTGQNQMETTDKSVQKTISIGINAGYDLLPSYNSDFTYYDVSGGIKFGLKADYNLGIWGLGLDYDFLKNSVSSSVSSPLFYDTLQINSSTKEEMTESISRQFIGIGPNLNFDVADPIRLSLSGRVGYAVTKGGELITTALHPDGSKTDHHVMFSGLDAAGLAVKAGLGIDYGVTEKLSVGLGVYYMNHLSVKPDRNFDLNNRGNMGIVYGHTPFEVNQSNYAIGLGAPYIIDSPRDFSDISNPFSSIGLNLGITYLLSSEATVKKEEKEISETVNNAKVILTVRDEISRKTIPGSDVIVKDLNGKIVSTGSTNSYGIVEINDLKPDNYVISANVYGTETSTVSLAKDDLKPNTTISKEVLYSDLRFILKGTAVNKRTRAGEPGVIISLTNTSNRSVQQESSGADGTFAFKLDKNTSYELVGVKENRLSETKRATTLGLTRSTTLFVNLELGVENFDCGRGTILDIKYAFDKSDLQSESKFELDRVIRYMKDHPTSIIEMSAHTDSRGDSAYNLSLSDKRAQSAMNYILSRGISSSRVTAQGYGETRLKNHCDDNANCSEVDHAINRRTEATLICRR